VLLLLLLLLLYSTLCNTCAAERSNNCLFMLPLAMMEHMHIQDLPVLPACNFNCCV
jgi:hypothetical protein